MTDRWSGVTAAWLSQHSSVATHTIPPWGSHGFSRVEEAKLMNAAVPLAAS